jgi:hypothetical protein
MRQTPSGSEQRIELIHGIIERTQSGNYRASVDGQHFVSINSAYGEMIAIALRVQEKMDIGKHPHIARLFSMMNCRKTAFVVGGKMSIDEATQNKEDIHGVELLLDDTMRLQAGGAIPVVGTPGRYHIREHLEEDRPSFPCVVHLYGIDNRRSGEVLRYMMQGKPLHRTQYEKMHRYHTFIILGKDTAGRYLCFQKLGPNPEHPFEITTLEDAELSLMPDTSVSEYCITMMGPLSAETTD